MSSPLSSAREAPRSVVFAAGKKPAALIAQLSAQPRLAGIAPAARMAARPAPEMVSSGIVEIDKLTGGLPRGCLTEVCGTPSSGRTSVLLAALAAATRRQEVCALVDASDAFDPLSAAAAGVDFEKLLWVRCGEWLSPVTIHDNTGAPPAAQRHKDKAHGVSPGTKAKIRSIPEGRKKQTAEAPLERALRVTDLLLQSGGFGMIVMDLGDIPFLSARRVPLTTWFRFQRAVETTPSLLFVVADQPLAQTCAALLLKLSAASSRLSDQANPSHAQLLEGLRIEGELLRSRLERKPAQSAAVFTTTAARSS